MYPSAFSITNTYVGYDLNMADKTPSRRAVVLGWGVNRHNVLRHGHGGIYFYHVTGNKISPRRMPDAVIAG